MKSDIRNPLGGDWHSGDAGCRFGNGLAIAEKPFNMELNAVADELFGGIEGWPCDTETGKVWCVGTPAGGRFLEDCGVLFHGLILSVSRRYRRSAERTMATTTTPSWRLRGSVMA